VPCNDFHLYLHCNFPPRVFSGNFSNCGKNRRGDEIPLLARVIAIADVYDALRSQRSYKTPFTREKAKAIIFGRKRAAI